VQKTYRRRQKAERSSPGHHANRDVDYDEVPPSTVQLSSLIANERKSPATQTATAAPIPRAPRKGKNGKITPPVAKTSQWLRYLTIRGVQAMENSRSVTLVLRFNVLPRRVYLRMRIPFNPSRRLRIPHHSCQLIW